MAAAYQNLSETMISILFPDAEKMKFGIVVSEWNLEYYRETFKGAVDTFKKTWSQRRKHSGKNSTGKF